MKLLFFFSLFMIFYVYLGYPIAIFLISLFRNKKVNKGYYEPFVSILIAAYNEADCIENTLKNKLCLDYPKEKLEIIVISDESTDGTDEVVKKYESQNVRLIRQAPRAGKTSALNKAAIEAKGDVLLFSDANSIWAKDALEKLVRNFNDPEVGYVTGKMIYADADGTMIGEGCSAYMKYENRLRKIETRMGSVVGVDGGVDAVRKELYQPMNADQLPDFVLPLKVVEQGYRVVYEPAAELWEASLKEASDEYRMRVRVTLRALWALFDMRELLGFQKNPLFSWQLWSHKVMRYLCFLFLLTTFLSNIILLGKGYFYHIFFFLQTLGYIAAICWPLLVRKGLNIKVLGFSRYFVLLNLAALHAFVKFLFGKKQALWAPRKG